VLYWSVVLVLSAAGSAASQAPNAEAVTQLERDGRSQFLACEFKRGRERLKEWWHSSPIELPHITGSASHTPDWPKYPVRILARGGGCGGQSCGRRAPLDTSSRSHSHEPYSREGRAGASVGRILLR
jgi:hypothetical protein